MTSPSLIKQLEVLIAQAELLVHDITTYQKLLKKQVKELKCELAQLNLKEKEP